MQKEKLLGLIDKVKKGDEVAYEELYRLYYPQIHRFALYISHCEADAHDIAQETMIAVHDKLYTLQKPEFFHSWIKRITINQSTKLFRKGKHVIYNDVVLHSLENTEDFDIDSNPIKTMHFQNDQELMTYFFGLLPNGQKAVMELLYFEQLSMKEIAKRLDVPEGTVKSRIHTAKSELKTKISRYEKNENIVLDFKSDALLTFLGGSSFLSTLVQPILKSKSFFSVGAMKASLIAVVGMGLGVGGIVTVKDMVDKQNTTKTRLPVQLNQDKVFTVAVVDELEIKTAQDAYFKLVTWANNEEDMKAASQQEIQEIEQLLNSLHEFGGSYYELLESDGWIEIFNKL